MGLWDSVVKIASPIVGGILGQKQAEEEASRAAEASQTDRSWQQKMSSTAYRRAVADMEAAGLNPILALGAPAATGKGSTAAVPNFAEAMKGGVATGLQALQVKEQLNQLKATTNNLKASTQKLRTESKVIGTKGAIESDKKKIYDIVKDALLRPSSAKEKITPIATTVSPRTFKRSSSGKETNLFDKARSFFNKAKGRYKNRNVPASSLPNKKEASKQLRISRDRKTVTFPGIQGKKYKKVKPLTGKKSKSFKKAVAIPAKKRTKKDWETIAQEALRLTGH